MLIETLDNHHSFYKLCQSDLKLKYFPIVNSVIYNTQSGFFYIKDKLSLVIHKFGFCYIVKAEDITWADIKNLKSELGIRIPKLRIYDPHGRLSSIEELKTHRFKRNKYIFDVFT